MKRCLYKIILLPIWLILLSSCGRAGVDKGFDEGHEWIVPRPAAEIRIKIRNDENQPITNAKIWIYLGNERTQVPEGLIDYVEEVGRQSNDAGEVMLQYLGEKGGGYEQPMDSAGPPQMYGKIEADGYESQVISIDELLFRTQYRTGKIEVEYDGEKIELVVIEHEVIMAEK